MKDCLHISIEVIATLTLKEDGLKKSLCLEMLTTDLADYLVRRGVPFREIHHIRLVLDFDLPLCSVLNFITLLRS